MSLLDRFEKGIERVVNGAFAKAFRSQVEPVELAGALRKEADSRAAVVSRGRTLTANNYTIELARTDYERLEPVLDELRRDLRQVVGEHAVSQSYSFVGPIAIALNIAEDLDTGMYRVRATTRRPDGSPAAQPANRGGYDPQSRANPVVNEYGRGTSRDRYTGSHNVVTGAHSGAGYAVAGASGHGSQTPGARTSGGAHGSAQGTFSVEVNGKRHTLSTGVTVFGRSASSADIVLDDPGISRRHFEISIRGGHASATDLGSTNGTLVDGRRITTINLGDGTTLRAGDTRIVFHNDNVGGT